MTVKRNELPFVVSCNGRVMAAFGNLTHATMWAAQRAAYHADSDLTYRVEHKCEAGMTWVLRQSFNVEGN